MLTVNSTINLAGQAVPNIIPAVQGDTGRVIVFTLADFSIPAGSTATYYVQKPSGEAVYNAATINNNKVTVELTAQSLAETGDNYGQVRILNGEDVVTSFDFILLVKPFRGIDAIESTTEMNIFDEAVQNAMEQFDSMIPDIIAPEFDSSTAYAAGNYTIYGGKLYQFTAAHSGAWTGADVEECTVAEKLGEGGSGDGLTEDIKQALLQIAEKVAYIDDQGATYYQALYDSFYPPVDLDSISAVYTQSGTVYDTDTLDSLKSNLVVTAHMSDQTTRTVIDYTLSGTLAEGTSTITVTYGGKTTTFDVAVTHNDNTIYNWDFTNSLIDSKQGVTATLYGSNASQGTTGVVFTGASSSIDLGTILEPNRTYEIDIDNVGLQVSNLNVRFIMYGSSPDTGTGILLWQKNSAWRAYAANSWSSGSYDLTGIGAFSEVNTIKMQIDSTGKVTLFTDGVSVGTDSHTFTFSASDHLYIGNTGLPTAGGNLYNITITGLRVYEGLV